MKVKTTLVALAMTLTPVIAVACPVHDQQAMSCAEGTTYDPQSETCVPKVNS